MIAAVIAGKIYHVSSFELLVYTCGFSQFLELFAVLISWYFSTHRFCSGSIISGFTVGVCVTVGDLYLVERIKIISAMFLPLKYTARVSTIAVNPLKCFEDQEYAMNDM